MANKEYLEALKTASIPDEEELQEINAQIANARYLSDFNGLNSLIAQKINTLVLDPFYSVAFFLRSNPHCYEHFVNNLEEMGADIEDFVLTIDEIFQILSQDLKRAKRILKFCAKDNYDVLCLLHPLQEDDILLFKKTADNIANFRNVKGLLSRYCAAMNYSYENGKKAFILGETVGQQKELKGVVDLFDEEVVLKKIVEEDGVFGGLVQEFEEFEIQAMIGFEGNPSLESFSDLYFICFLKWVFLRETLPDRERCIIDEIFLNEDPDCRLLYKFCIANIKIEKMMPCVEKLRKKLPLWEDVEGLSKDFQEAFYDLWPFLYAIKSQKNSIGSSFQKGLEHESIEIEWNDKDYRDPDGLLGIGKELRSIGTDLLKNVSADHAEVLSWLGDPTKYNFRDIVISPSEINKGKENKKDNVGRLFEYWGIKRQYSTNPLRFCIFINALANMGYLDNTADNLRAFAYRMCGPIFPNVEHKKDKIHVGIHKTKGQTKHCTPKALFYIIKHLVDYTPNYPSMYKRLMEWVEYSSEEDREYVKKNTEKSPQTRIINECDTDIKLLMNLLWGIPIPGRIC